MALNKKQKATIDKIVEYVDKIDKTKRTGQMYRETLSALTEEQFHDYMLSLKNGEDTLYIQLPNLMEKGVTFENNLKVAKELGIDFFKKLRIVDPKTGKRFLTNKKYCILHLPVRRQIQTIDSGISTATDDTKIDPTTGQVIMDSQAAMLSIPETFVLYSRGLNKSIVELTKIRGGDTEAMRDTYRKLEQTGSATVTEAMKLGTRAQSTVTLNNMFKAMHIDNNI